VRSFSAAATGSYVDGNPRVLIAGAGDSDELEAASEALGAALRASGKVRMVIDDSALGDLGRLKDAAVVKRAAGQPVDVVCVLRVFGGDKETAVATFYDKKGNSLGALSVEKGAHLEPRGEEHGAGVSSDTANAVSRVLHGDKDGKADDGTPKDPKEAEYDRRHIGFYTHVTVNVISGQAWGTWGGPYQGDGGNPLDVADYFRNVGRDDLSDYYRSGTRRKIVFGATGGVLILGGVVAGLSSIFATEAGRCQEQSVDGDCLKRDMSTFYAVLGTGIGATALGVAALIVAGKTHRWKLNERETYKLAADYNRKLRRDLGLPPRKDQDVPDEVQGTSTASVAVTPTVGPQGGGLSLKLTF
jgi:hypothetical protein